MSGPPVKGGSGFVTHDQFRVVNESPRQCDPLLLTTRELRRQRVGPMGHAQGNQELFTTRDSLLSLDPCSRRRPHGCPLHVNLLERFSPSNLASVVGSVIKGRCEVMLPAPLIFSFGCCQDPSRDHLGRHSGHFPTLVRQVGGSFGEIPICSCIQPVLFKHLRVRAERILKS